MGMKRRDLTKEVLKDLLDYDPETGVFTWKARAAKYIKSKTYSTERVIAILMARDVGKVAGTICKKGYRRISVLGVSHAAHHLAVLYMKGRYPIEVDHENLKKDDNRWENLREATSQQNARNRGIRSDSTTGLKGVKPFPGGKFHARIQTSQKRISLGLFDCKAAAHFAYIIAADKHHGEFARSA